MEKKLEEELQRLRLLVDDGDAEDVLERLRQLRELPAFPAEELWQLDELAGACCSVLCDMERAAGCYWQASTHDKYLRSQMGHYSSYLFCLHYLSDISDQEMKQAHFFYDRLFADVRRYEHQAEGRRRKKKLRIGYLSTDFHDHAMADFIRPLLSLRDSSRYEAYCYAMQETRDEVTQEFCGMADGWRDLSGRSFADAAQCIFADGVDILFDLSGHTHGGCTLITAAYKPAPVQLSGIGWFDTTGLSAIDYFLTDPFLEDEQERFCEQLLTLPQTHMSYLPQALPPISSAKRRAGITFGCFNNFAKITDEMLVLWLTIVRSVPGARLHLQDTSAMPARCIALRSRAGRMGWREEELELSSGAEEYLQSLAQIDIALDPYPYQGGSMTCAALRIGVPVVTLAGTRHGARLGASLLSNAGLPELIAGTPAEYKKIAVSLARDTERCVNLHRTLPGLMQASRLMDGRAYMRDLEQAYERIWDQWLNSQT